jgi:hypothetical protein
MKAITALAKRIEKIEEAVRGLRTSPSREDRWFRAGCLLREAAKRMAAEKGISEEEAMKIIPPNLREYMAARERGESPGIGPGMLAEEMRFIAESFKNYQAAQERGDKQ